MSNITTTLVNGKIRYRVELSPGASVETSTLSELLNILFELGGNNGEV